MAEKKGVGHAYNVDFLNVVFAASSIFLFLSVIWMVWDDFNRDWKNTQREFTQLELEVTRASEQKARQSVDKNKLTQLQSQKAAAEKSAAGNQQKIDELQDKISDVEKRLYRENQDYQFAKATYDHDRYEFETLRAAGNSKAASMEQDVKEQEKRVAELNLAVEKTTAERNALNKQLGEFTGAAATAQKSIDELHAEETRLQKRIDVIEPSFLKDYFRNCLLYTSPSPRDS